MSLIRIYQPHSLTWIIKLSDWANKWQLHFNPEKCEVMRVTHSRDRSKPSCCLGMQLKSVESVKDLGVTINYDLSWGKHLSYIKVNKANKVLGVIKRSLGNDNRYAFSCLFESLVRPTLEYAAPVWSPYQKKDIESLEKVQRRASRFALKQKHGEMSYEDRCRFILNWKTLEKSREFLSLVQCCKIVFGIDSLSFLDFFELTKCSRTWANHDYKLYVKVAILNCYKYSFFVRIVNAWNNLPKDVVCAGSLTLFCNRLRIYMNIDWYNCVNSFNYSMMCEWCFLFWFLGFRFFSLYIVFYILDFTFSSFILGNLLHCIIIGLTSRYPLSRDIL